MKEDMDRQFEEEDERTPDTWVTFVMFQCFSAI
jgi:hypothetical protein